MPFKRVFRRLIIWVVFGNGVMRVFSDVVMPGMNGIDLAHEIGRRYPGLPIILASGYSQVLVQQGTSGLQLLQKPYSLEELSRVLRQASTSRK